MYKIKTAVFIGWKLADHVTHNKKLDLILSITGCKNYKEFSALAKSGKLSILELQSSKEFSDYIKKGDYDDETKAKKYLDQLLFVIQYHKSVRKDLQAGYTIFL